MDDSQAGPSGIKKRKLVCKDPKKLTNDELSKFLEETSDDEKYFSNDGDNFDLEDELSSDETDDSDDEEGRIILFVLIFIFVVKFTMLVNSKSGHCSIIQGVSKNFLVSFSTTQDIFYCRSSFVDYTSSSSCYCHRHNSCCQFSK